MSSISWLDASTEEQQRMREILGLFTEQGTRDELGLGQIRDSISDGLFPGTSTLHTRARYLLFVPWIYQFVSANGGKVTNARNQELALISALKSSGANTEGTIGMEAGNTLKTVPSSVYWSALSRFGILTSPGLTREQAIEIEGAETPADMQVSDVGERGAQRLRAWKPSLPHPPEAFPNAVPGGMTLTADEASWLQERILDSTTGTLLAHLAVNAPDQESSEPWKDPSALAAPDEPRHLLEHAQRFSDTIQGAQLLYNLMIAESYEREGFTRLEGHRDDFRNRLAQWSAYIEEQESELPWDLDDFFMLVTNVRGGRRVAKGSERLVRDWVQLIQEHGSLGLAANEDARDLVKNREYRNKGKMAWIDNKERLGTWGGSSGAGRFTYRWSYVQTILGDIHRGLDLSTADMSAAEIGILHA